MFADSGWEEHPWSEADGVKLVKTRFGRAYRGDLDGRSVTELLMVYRTDGVVTFAGFERFEGQVLGRAGTFVIQCDGEYRDGFADSRGRVLPGAGTGELRMLRGEASYRAGHAAEHSVVYYLGFE